MLLKLRTPPRNFTHYSYYSHIIIYYIPLLLFSNLYCVNDGNAHNAYGEYYTGV